eukprot:4283131-Alexandrium_andersonii.AAC.1
MDKATTRIGHPQEPAILQSSGAKPNSFCEFSMKSVVDKKVSRQPASSRMSVHHKSGRVTDAVRIGHIKLHL